MYLLSSGTPEGFFEFIIYMIREFWPMLLEGIGKTLIIALSGTLFGLIISFFLASARIQEVTNRDNSISKAIKKIGKTSSVIYIDFFRGTPMMVQAIFIYNFVYSKGIHWSVLSAGIIIVSLNSAAYLAEIIRSGILSVDKGQVEAARSLGMTTNQAMTNVVLPQAFKNAIPAIGNELVVNIKDSSVLMVIGLAETYFMAKSIAGVTYRTSETFFLIAIIYLLLTIPSTRLLTYLDKLLNSPSNKSFPSSQSVPEAEVR